jgi:WS/DGAT/MGAT family acyltransferase
MVDRLTSQDVSFLHLEGPSTPMHVGGLAVFAPPPGGFDFAAIVAHIEQRIGLVPRYRQVIRWVPGHLANPVWVDDVDFDIGYHVRRSALPRPGSAEQLRELVGRLQARPLDRERPLWEMNVVEGLADGRFAIVTKTHQAMVDGIHSVDLAQVILDPTPAATSVEAPSWQARPEPGAVELVVDALTDVAHRPSRLADTARMAVNEVRTNTGRAASAIGDVLGIAHSIVRSAPSTPLNAAIGSQRRFAAAQTSLSDYRHVRGYVNGTVNDVALATVAGALRSWLLSRGRPVTPSTTVRAMVPVSVRPLDAGVGLGNRVSSYFIDLPVGEPNPLLRLTQISYAMMAHKDSGQSVGADALVALSGFAPPTLVALGARAANGITRRMFNLVITNVPGPQNPLYLAGAELTEMYPIVPLAPGQALTVALTSYNGRVYFGLNADWDAMADVEVLAGLLDESLTELVAAVDEAPQRSHLLAARPDPVQPR